MVNLSELNEYDIENVLQNSENGESTIFQKISTACSKFRFSLSVVIDEYFTKEKEFNEKSQLYSESTFQMNNQIKSTKKELDAVLFNQKVTEREISNVIKRYEKLQEHCKHIMDEREQIALEIVDLEQELEERRKEKKLNWDALKRACAIYKDKLDIRIKVDSFSDKEIVRIIYFVKQHEENYYVDLSHKHKSWKVEKIEPDLKAIHRNDLNKVIDFTNDFQVENITAFLCRLRYIFLKYYFDK